MFVDTKRLVRKAASSTCRSKVGAVAINHDGKILGYARNDPRFSRKGGGVHAEMALMRRYRRQISKIILCRVGAHGFMAIAPCSACSRKAADLGIMIEVISGISLGSSPEDDPVGLTAIVCRGVVL